MRWGQGQGDDLLALQQTFEKLQVGLVANDDLAVLYRSIGLWGQGISVSRADSDNIQFSLAMATQTLPRLTLGTISFVLLPAKSAQGSLTPSTPIFCLT